MRTTVNRQLARLPAATSFESCIRQCVDCKVGASNAQDPAKTTYIYLNPLENIPAASRDGAAEALRSALNVGNRDNKWVKFGFSTSEDAVTWVIFSYLARKGRLIAALRKAGLIENNPEPELRALLLWGSTLVGGAVAEDLREAIHFTCVKVGESADRTSEPDVLIDCGAGGVVAIEVKHLSGNDVKPREYAGWTRYIPCTAAFRDDASVLESGCYELARYWRLLHEIRNDRPMTLVNLGPQHLFAGNEGKRLDRFMTGLAQSRTQQFRKLTWGDLIESIGPLPRHVREFCSQRRLGMF